MRIGHTAIRYSALTQSSHSSHPPPFYWPLPSWSSSQTRPHMQHMLNSALMHCLFYMHPPHTASQYLHPTTLLLALAFMALIANLTAGAVRALRGSAWAARNAHRAGVPHFLTPAHASASHQQQHQLSEEGGSGQQHGQGSQPPALVSLSTHWWLCYIAL